MFGEFNPKLRGINNTGAISNNGINDLIVNNGGTAQSSFSNLNSLVLTGASATGNLQTIANGASTTILTSQGVGVLPAWSALTVGSLVFISTSTASNSASISFTNLSSTYFAYYIVYVDLRPATNSTTLYMRTSTNNGSSYDNSASNYTYGYNFFVSGSSGFAAGSTGDTQIILKDTINSTNNANNKVHGEILLTGFATSGNNALIHYRGTECLDAEGTPDFNIHYGSGSRLSTTTVNAIQFLMSSGNMSTGTFKLYGIKA